MAIVGARHRRQGVSFLVVFTYLSASARVASCPAAGTGDIYHAVDLPAGGQVVYRVAAVRETDGVDLVNRVQVLPDAGVNDPDMANNTAMSTNAPYRQYMPLVVRSQ